MPIFTYKAITDKGIVVKNSVEAANKEELVRKLKANKIVPISIKRNSAFSFLTSNYKMKKNTVDIEQIMRTVETVKPTSTRKDKLTTKQKISIYLSGSEKVTSRDLIIFTQNFYLLKKANFNNIHALATIVDSTENRTLKGIIKDILAGVESGENIYTTMEYYSDVFPYIYINMIKVGELSGSLTQSLEQALTYLETSTDLNTKVKKIIIPNVITFSLLIILLVVGTIVAVPAIQGLFEEIGSTETLPAITLWFSDFINGVIKYWPIPTVIIAAVIAYILYYISTPKGRYDFDHFKYTMPIFGKLLYQIDFSRFIRAMALNLQNGMRIQNALEVSKNVAKNVVMLSMVETASNNALIGESWIQPFENAAFTSSMEIEMLKIGMQTNLTEMMLKLVDIIDVEIDNSLEKIMKVLPQVVAGIVGAVLIFFVVVVLVPIIQVYMGNFLISAYL